MIYHSMANKEECIKCRIKLNTGGFLDRDINGSIDNRRRGLRMWRCNHMLCASKSLIIVCSTFVLLHSCIMGRVCPCPCP